MRILICDDDSLILETLEIYLKEFFVKSKLEHPEISFFTNGDDLLKDTGEKDIVFLDIEMPGVSGIFVGNKLKQQNENILIFVVTSYSEYLDDAMRFHVFRYLSKPIDKQRLFRNLKDALSIYNTTTHNIFIETKGESYNIPATEIKYVEAKDNKILVITKNATYVSLQTMKYWAAQLLSMQCFFQSHRSYIVNLAYVDSFDHTLIHLVSSENPAYLTRRKYTQFKQAYLLYLESTR